MKKIACLLLGIVFIISCKTEPDGQIYFSINEKDLIPEGITYSKTTNSFYVSSILKTKIIQIDAETGNYKDFTTSDYIDLRFLGMIVDDENKHLWACGNISREDKRISAVVKLDLLTGKLLHRYEYPDTSYTMYNDLAMDNNGNVYFTNSENTWIYKIDSQTDSVSIFINNENLSHPNGISISPDSKYLYIASNRNGIQVLDITKKEFIGTPDTSLHSYGIDGLKYHNNSLIAIQNAVRTYEEINISRFILDESGTKIISKETIDVNNPLFNDVPTTFAIKDNCIYSLNSQLNKVDFSNYTIREGVELNDVQILKYKL